MMFGERATEVFGKWKKQDPLRGYAFAMGYLMGQGDSLRAALKQSQKCNTAQAVTNAIAFLMADVSNRVDDFNPAKIAEFDSTFDAWAREK